MMGWIKCSEKLPELGDYSVLAYFADNGAVEMVHVEDYFKDITAGIFSGEQLYTKWYIARKITHWHLMPEPPKH